LASWQAAGDREVLPAGDREVLPAGDREVLPAGDREVLPAGGVSAVSRCRAAQAARAPGRK
jgi:hypothetical protein